MRVRVPALVRLGEAKGFLRALTELARVATLLPAEPGHIVLDVPESFFQTFFETDDSDAEPEEPEGDVLDQDEDEAEVRRIQCAPIKLSDGH